MDSRRSLFVDAILTAVPTFVFVVAGKVSTMQMALVWTLLLSFLIVLFRMVRHEWLLHALIAA